MLVVSRRNKPHYSSFEVPQRSQQNFFRMPVNKYSCHDHHQDHYQDFISNHFYAAGPLLSKGSY